MFSNCFLQNINFDMLHANRTICILKAVNHIEPKNFICYNVDDFTISWTFISPELVTKLSCAYISILFLSMGTY